MKESVGGGDLMDWIPSRTDLTVTEEEFLSLFEAK